MPIYSAVLPADRLQRLDLSQIVAHRRSVPPIRSVEPVADLTATSLLESDG